MSKKLIEEEVLNKTYSAISIHINLLKEFDITLGNSYQRERLEKSIQYLEETLVLLKPIEDEIKVLKRKAYSEYKKAKEELRVYKNSRMVEEKTLKSLEKNVELRLKLYIAYKGNDVNSKVDKYQP